jgi:hypothetical protein
MPEEFTWGPVHGQMHHASHGTFAANTPQEVSLAYIFE